MKTKYVNNILNVLIVVAVIFSGYKAANYVSSFAAPEYEVVDLNLKWNYEFTTEDGQKISSHYLPAWHNGKAVAYDPVYKKSVDFNVEYINEITEQMPPSKYGTFSHWAGILSWVVLVIVGIIVWIAGIWIKELLLGIYALITGNFADVAYFFKEKRWAGNIFAKKAYKKEVWNYVENKRKEIERKYKPESAKMLIGLLEYMKYEDSPRIPYLFSMKNDTIEQVAYINRLLSYWETQIGKKENAEQQINYLRPLREKKYATYTIFTKEEDVVSKVSEQLDKVFERLMGEHIFSFEAYSKHWKPELNVEIKLENSLNTFKWNGSGHSGETFPGIDLKMTISRKGNQLWDIWLSPVCTYTAEEDNMVVGDFYENMIRETISTFADQIK